MNEGITRTAIHKIVDEKLTEMGYGESVRIERGSLFIQIQFENFKPSLKIKERELEKI
jgi:hypothetical protein